MVIPLAIFGHYAWSALAPAWNGASTVTLYQQNLLFNRPDDAALLAEIRARRPDLVTLQEVSDANTRLMEALKPDYPYQLRCRVSAFLGEALLSRHPFDSGTERCSERDGLAVARVLAPAGPLWVISLHISWPWPHGQAEQLTQILPLLDAVDGAVVLAGDFNAVAWSDALRRVEGASGTHRVGAVRRTFNLPYGAWPVTIDHVLSTGPGRVDVLPKHGSDHHGLWAELDPWSGG